ncbi:hypothetical protein H9623_01780 [Oerskovia sp. Sa1BUA8]|uniref:Uncharacterized protein n=1 Tax=Oerskovia douganii TaxID=2762210 RepID=A0A9D5YWY9_9CELL|nr:hypothetical protein [Oerskovia douganii]MBE7699038.1 hypothetical protein [Oerskovia douganii]
MTRRRLHGDEGLASSGLLATVLVVVFAVALVAVLPLLRGTEQGGRARTVADAAALAGAERVREHFLDELAGVPVRDLTGGNDLGGTWWPTRSPLPSMGYSAANDYAHRNDGEVLPAWYAYDVRGGTVTVRARLLEPAPGGGRTESSARARLGIDLSTCWVSADREEIEPEPEPTPEPTPDPSPSESPTPTPSPTPTEPPPPEYTDWVYSFGCDGVRRVSGDDLRDVLAEARQRVVEAATPRLVDPPP